MDGKSLNFQEQLFLFANQQQALNNVLSRSKAYVELLEGNVVVLKEWLSLFELVVDMILPLAKDFRAVEDVLRISGLVPTPLYLTTLIPVEEPAPTTIGISLPYWSRSLLIFLVNRVESTSDRGKSGQEISHNYGQQHTTKAEIWFACRWKRQRSFTTRPQKLAWPRKVNSHTARSETHSDCEDQKEINKQNNFCVLYCHQKTPLVLHKLNFTCLIVLLLLKVSSVVASLHHALTVYIPPLKTDYSTFPPPSFPQLEDMPLHPIMQAQQSSSTATMDKMDGELGLKPVSSG